MAMRRRTSNCRTGARIWLRVFILMVSSLCFVDAFTSPATTSRRVMKTNHIDDALRRSPSKLRADDSRSLCRIKSVQTFSMQPHANLAVSIDQSLLPKKSAGIPVFKYLMSAGSNLLSVISSELVRKSVLGIAIALLLSFLVQNLSVAKGIGGILRFFKGRMLRTIDWLKPAGKEGVPMSFSDTENDGWGVCTLRSKRRLGKTSFVQYDFDLPKSNQILPLKLGQQASLCCLDNSGSVAKGDFYVYHPKANSRLGGFSIVAPNKSSSDNEYMLGYEAAHFTRILKEDLKVGDEIAVKLGRRRLEYRGQHFPVTDMVYIASSVGIVPILEQVRAVLPSGSSSVKSVTVLWIDESQDDFDVISDQLEREYYKYTTKLAVSCVVDNMKVNTLADNMAIVSSIPEFIPGTMAVISGPANMQRKATNYLISRGYPEDCVCEL